MLLKETYNKEDLALIEKLYLDAFPPSERKPFSVILEKCKEGTMEILKIEDDASNFVGLVMMVLYKDLALLDYFAIAENQRDYGYGSQVLKLLNERYHTQRLIVEIENPEIPSDNTAERIRRKAFYLKNHLIVMPFQINYFGVEMLILTNGKTVTYEEYDEMYKQIFDSEIYENVTRII